MLNSDTPATSARPKLESAEAQAALYNSDTLHRFILERIPAPLFVYDRETLRYLAVSDAAIAEYGYSREEFLRMTIADIRPPEDVPALKQMLARSGVAFEHRGVWRHRKKDGTLIDVDITTHGLDLQGRPACIVLAKDVTEQLQAQAALRHKSNLLQAVVDGTSDAVYVKDRSGKYLLFNRAASSFVGRTIDEVLGQDDLYVFGPKDGRAVIENDRMVMASNQTQTVEEQLTAAGVTRTYLATKGPFRDADGKVIGVIGISRDITELAALNATLETRVQERTRELSESLQFNRATLDALSAHVAVLDSQGDIVATNAAWKEFAPRNGLPFQLVSEGTNYLKVCDSAAARGDAEAAHVAKMLRAILAGLTNTYQFEYTCHAPDEKRWFLCRMTLCYIGNEPHVVVAHEDVSSIKLIQEALTNAKEEADRANLAKSEFLAAMSHELRTPLNGILGMNSLLLQSELNDRQRQFAEACKRSGTLLSQLINDVLDLSRIEAGKLELDPRACDIECLIYDMIEMVSGEALQKGLKLDCCLAAELSAVAKFDDNRLRQIMLNLLGNAIKFTAAGRVDVAGKMVYHSGAGSRLRVEISDTGVGIPTDRHHRLFQPFYQGDSSTTRHYGGSGLGLSVCQRLVDLMGGQIGVQSQVGMGSLFWFEIPIQLAEGASKLPTWRMRLAGTPVLVVESTTHRSQISECLTAWDCSPQYVATTLDALRILDEESSTAQAMPIAIVDIRDLGRDQLEHLELLVAATGGSILFIGSSLLDDRQSPLGGLSAGRTLTGPVRPSQLFAGLSSLVSPDQAAQIAPTHPASTQTAASLSGHVLVAEDNTINQLYIAELLRSLGCTLEVVKNGCEAVAAMQSKQYDLVLMDCQMPTMDGFAAAREIRKMEAAQLITRPIPIIALTANALKGERERCLDAGMDDYLSKPVESERLRSTILKYLRAAKPDTNSGTNMKRD